MSMGARVKEQSVDGQPSIMSISNTATIHLSHPTHAKPHNPDITSTIPSTEIIMYV